MGCEKSSGATRRPKEFYGVKEGRSKNLVKIHGMDFFPQGKKYNGIIYIGVGHLMYFVTPLGQLIPF